MTGAALLASLHAHGVMVAINAAGDGLTLTGKGRPPAELLDEVRAAKVELLEALRPAKEEHAPTFPTLSPSPVAVPDTRAAEVVSNNVIDAPSPVSDPLPAHLAELLELARAGQLPKGAVKLASGLVTDLAGYVIAWAECWPRDRAHVLSRLEAAYAAVRL